MSRYNRHQKARHAQRRAIVRLIGHLRNPYSRDTADRWYAVDHERYGPIRAAKNLKELVHA